MCSVRPDRAGADGSKDFASTSSRASFATRGPAWRTRQLSGCFEPQACPLTTRLPHLHVMVPKIQIHDWALLSTLTQLELNVLPFATSLQNGKLGWLTA